MVMFMCKDGFLPLFQIFLHITLDLLIIFKILLSNLKERTRAIGISLDLVCENIYLIRNWTFLVKWTNFHLGFSENQVGAGLVWLF